MLTTDNICAYHGGIETVGGNRPRQTGGIFIPSSWGMREPNTSNKLQRPMASIESPTRSFIEWKIEIIGAKMTNNLISYQFKNNNVRMVMVADEPWFVADDVCKALELTNPSMVVSRLDDDERSKFNLGRQGETNIVNEFGLYNLILGSRKPEAKEFKRWVTHEVLPAIRKDGAYAMTDVKSHRRKLPTATVKKEIELSEKEHRAIGGIVKSCASVAVRETMAECQSKPSGVDTFAAFDKAIDELAVKYKPYDLSDSEIRIIEGIRHERAMFALRIFSNFNKQLRN